MAMKHDSKEYHAVRGSDVDRDGMYIEVGDTPNVIDPMLEIFYSDVTHQMSVNLFKPDIPLEVVEWAISRARKSRP